MGPLLDLAGLQDKVFSAFSPDGQGNPVSFHIPPPARNLLEALSSAAKVAAEADPEVKLPKGVVMRLSDVAAIFPDAGQLLSFWKKDVMDFSKLLEPWNEAKFKQAWDDLWNEKRWEEALATLEHFGARQALLGVSLVTTTRHYVDLLRDPTPLVDAYNAYFFSEKGFLAVDGTYVPKPAFPSIGSSLPDTEKALEGYFGLQTGERYLRDLIRITVETGADVQFKLRKRVPKLAAKKGLTAAQQKIAHAWLLGFASMAEGLVMSSVEQVAQGISTFRANPLIAAAASTSAAVAARKATQHAFLTELGI